MRKHEPPLPSAFYRLLALVKAHPRASYRFLSERMELTRREGAMMLNALVTHDILVECGCHDYPWWELTPSGVEVFNACRGAVKGEWGDPVPLPPRFKK